MPLYTRRTSRGTMQRWFGSKAKQRCVMGVGMCLYGQLVQTKNKQFKSAIILQFHHPHLSDFCSRTRLTRPYNHIIYPDVARIYLVFFWKCLLYLLILLFLNIKGCKYLYIGGCCQAKVDNAEILDALDAALQRICGRNNSPLLLAGDFNLRGLNWVNKTIKQNCPYPSL